MRFFQFVDRWLIPLVLVATWSLLFATSNVRGLAAVVTFGGFLVIVLLYGAYKELRVHAGASRHAAQGDPDELLALANREIERRWRPRSRTPFHIYRSIAHQLLGEWDAARDDLERLGDKPSRHWGILHAAQRINLLTHAGDAAAARKVLDEELRIALRKARGAGAAVMLDEAEARVLFAEGRVDEARPIFERLAKDMRLGAATRAICRWYAGRCVEAHDPDAARAAFEEAAKIAPKVRLG